MIEKEKEKEEDEEQQQNEYDWVYEEHPLIFSNTTPDGIYI